MYDSGPSHLEVAQRLLREDPAMGVNAFCDEYKRITGDCITRSNLRQWFGLNAASIRRGFLDESLSSHAAGMVIANPQLGHRLLMTQPASRPGSRPPEALVDAWLRENRHAILAAPPALEFGKPELSPDVAAVLPRLIFEYAEAGRALTSSSGARARAGPSKSAPSSMNSTWLHIAQLMRPTCPVWRTILVPSQAIDPKARSRAQSARS